MKISKNNNIRTNIILPKETHYWLKKVALAKETSVCEEIRDIINYVKRISNWGAVEINNKLRNKI